MTRKDLRHLPNQPHRDALHWLWRGRRTDFDGCAFAGSQLQMQIYVNRYPQELTAAICRAVEGLSRLESSIRWVAPLEREKFREYWDAEALRILGLDSLQVPLEKFWPVGGPHWDALAVVEGAERRGAVLVEAKSYPDEVFSSGSQAMAPGSVDRIATALVETQKLLQVSTAVDWTGRLYQSANRLAHLHFFRAHGVPAGLANVYFCDTPEPGRCTTRTDWERTIRDVKRELGLDPAKPIPYTGDVFLQARRRTELKLAVPSDGAVDAGERFAHRVHTEDVVAVEHAALLELAGDCHQDTGLTRYVMSPCNSAGVNMRGPEE